MKKTVLLGAAGVCILVLLLGTTASSTSSPTAPAPLWNAIAELKAQISRLWVETATLKSRVNGDEADETALLGTAVGNGGPEPTALNAYLKIEGVPGEAADDAHPGWIEILGLTHAIGRAAHGEFTVTKMLDKSSPKLAMACSGGQHFPQVILELCRAEGGQELVMQYIFKDVIITKMFDKATPKLATSLSGEISYVTDRPTESISFNYTEIEWTYVPEFEEPVEGGWNVVINQPVAVVPD